MGVRRQKLEDAIEDSEGDQKRQLSRLKRYFEALNEENRSLAKSYFHDVVEPVLNSANPSTTPGDSE